MTMRVIARKLTECLGQQLIVDKPPGAGGVIAATAATSAPPDGYTLLQIGNGAAISKLLFKSLPFDVEREFTPISGTAEFDLVLLTKSESPLKTMRPRAHARAGSISAPSPQGVREISPRSCSGSRQKLTLQSSPNARHQSS